MVEKEKAELHCITQPAEVAFVRLEAELKTSQIGTWHTQNRCARAGRTHLGVVVGIGNVLYIHI